MRNKDRVQAEGGVGGNRSDPKPGGKSLLLVLRWNVCIGIGGLTDALLLSLLMLL